MTVKPGGKPLTGFRCLFEGHTRHPVPPKCQDWISIQMDGKGNHVKLKFTSLISQRSPDP